MFENKRIVILGGGPAGLAAGYRLKELGYQNWIVFERNPYAGGLSASFRDAKGFVWDIGGHVLFSHYKYFDALVEKLLGDSKLSHLRESWIRIMNRWIPYPFQNNIKFLPQAQLYECIGGLYDASLNGKAKANNFEDWIRATFGEGISKHFMYPYNSKVWATPLEHMSKDWIAERVSVIDFKRILENVILDKEDVSWGPNNKFIFPLHGGTGEIFKRLSDALEERIVFRCEAIRVDPKNKIIYFNNGRTEHYDILINTTPLDKLIGNLAPMQSALIEEAANLRHVGGLMVGLGFSRPINTEKCWVYFPEDNCPFYRMTYFHNYSPNNVPNGDVKSYSSLMCETSYSDTKNVDKGKIIGTTVDGLIKSGIIEEKDAACIISEHVNDCDYTYPVPTLNRDKALKTIQTYLESNDIYSRGRFGAWKYEIANMDHCAMQGIEIIDRLLNNVDERTWSL